MKRASIRIMKKTVSRAHRSPLGAASLLVTIMVGLLLIAIIASLSVISNRESRQASDVDLSNKAFSAAETGVQQAAAQLNANPNYHQEACNASAAAPTVAQPETSLDANTAITCSIVSSQTNNFATQLARDKTVQINLSGLSVGGMLVQWNDKTNDSTVPTPADFTSTCQIPPNFAQLNPSANGYPQNYTNCGTQANGWPFPAMLEMHFIWWSKSGPNGTGFTASDLSADSTANSLNSKDIVVVPYESNGTTERLDDTSVSPSTTNTPGSVGSGLLNGCSTNTPGSYRCSLGVVSSVSGSYQVTPLNLNNVIANASSQNIIVRVTARYAGTNLSFQFYPPSSNTPMTFTGPASTIDVTARVNDLYRRTISQKPVQTQIIDFLDNAMYSGGILCKNLKVNQSNNPVTGDNGKNASPCP